MLDAKQKLGRVQGPLLQALAGSTRRSGRFLVAGSAVALVLAACQVDGRFSEVPAGTCSSEEIWTYSEKDSPLMAPGKSCVQCHLEVNDDHHAPFYKFAGTVMQTLHEGDDCRGAPELNVILTDANDREWRLPVNSAGNFLLDPDNEVALPYTARIVDKAGNERVKQTAIEDGDCNGCHTRDGDNGAAGRLTPPELP